MRVTLYLHDCPPHGFLAQVSPDFEPAVPKLSKLAALSETASVSPGATPCPSIVLLPCSSRTIKALS